MPTLHGLKQVLVGDRGAGVAAGMTVAFVLSDAGYFLPYGGNSPGPRFLVPALPFLAGASSA